MRKSGLNDAENSLVWNELVYYLKDLNEQNTSIVIKPSVVKTLIQTMNYLGNDALIAVECFLQIGNSSKLKQAVEYKFDLLCDLFQVSLSSHSTNIELVQMIAKKFLTSIRVYSNTQK
ncbi:unnamed protein product [Didymodactylos carnosus]|uniref:Uncharacterized protein n=1 Tax=Didymodactylos carnosus TaxID=1234261 RepID=A0A814CKG7_9BILA|nr:unnamed protein product [Didymodactylos carnosus]CAF1263783.1 unnamed protein product [Didymodactylos carnosus]CAF3719706.1 unnamed protein product [Didymodactylos carnosus]CAF4070158.1 unnamed protein product [Didymodactylos carnosus]